MQSRSDANRIAAAGLRLALATFVLTLALAPALAMPTPQEDAVDDANVTVPSEWLDGMQYRLIGPSRGGRSTAVTGIADQPLTFYMGTTGGGVWKTTNAGLSWDNVSDGHIHVGSIGAVEVAPSDTNVVYVGTGSACPRGNVSPGDGIYRSTDAGKTWTHIGLPQAGQIGRVRVHPRDPDLVYVAVLGNVFGPNEERGVYRSRDGGASWEKVLYVSDGAGAVDLAMDPANPRVLYAAIWRVERKPWTLIDGGPESGLYRSTDGGDTWSKLGGGLPTGEIGRIGVTVSPARPGRVWALVTAGEERGGVFRSDDGGDSWRRVSDDRELQTRGWYYSHITADPADENTAYVMNGGFWRSIDGGSSWARVRTPHGDNHDVWINPHDTDIFIEANDGGSAVTLDGGENWTSQLNQPTAEFYRVTVDDQFPYRVYGAQQDNSTISVPSRPGGSSVYPLDWYTVGGGESGHIAVKPGDPDTVFAGNYIGQIDRYDRRTGSAANVVIYPQMQDGTAPRDLRYRFQWNAPILFSQHDPEALYHTSNYVHRSRDGGHSWETISPDLTTDNDEQQELPGGPIQHDHTGVETYNTIFALAESPFDADELWAGSDDGRIHVTRDGGATWSDITPPQMPADGTVNVIDLSRHQPGRAFVAVYRYRSADMRPYVFVTDDRGSTWRSLADGSNGIPADHFVRVVREDPDRQGLLYAGTEFGMYVSFDDGAHWQSFQLNLPITPVTDLIVHQRDLVVATQGRSFWILDDLTPLYQLQEAMAAKGAFLFRPRDAVRTPGGGFFAGALGTAAPPVGVSVRYWLSEEPEQEATLEILDTDGAVLRTYRGKPGEEAAAPGAGRRRGGPRNVPLPVKKGMNRFSWDLRLEGPETVEGAQFSLAGTGGYAVPPGTYGLRLSVGETVLQTEARVLVDPRMPAAEAGLLQQYELLGQVKALLERAHVGVRQLRSARDQVRAAAARVEAAGVGGDWKSRAEEIAGSLTAVEDRLIQSRSKASQDPINFPPQLDDQIAYLYSHVNEQYGTPTEGSYERYDDLAAQLDALLDELHEVFDGPLAALDADLRAAGAAGVLLPRSGGEAGGH